MMVIVWPNLSDNSFSCFVDHLISILVSFSLQGWLQTRKQVKISWCQVRRVLLMLETSHIVTSKVLIDQDDLICRCKWTNYLLVQNGPPTFQNVPSDCILQSKKGIVVHFLSICSTLYYEFIVGNTLWINNNKIQHNLSFALAQIKFVWRNKFSEQNIVNSP